MTDSPEAAPTSTRALPATPSFGASDALSVRGAPITRRTSVCAASDSRRVARVRPCSSRRAASSRPRSASCTTSPARVAAMRVSRARSPPKTSATAAAAEPTSRQRAIAAEAGAAAAGRASARPRARRWAGGGAVYASASAWRAASSSRGSSTPMGRSSATEFPPGERSPQALDAVANPGLHGAQRRAVARRDLAVREPFEVGRLDRPSLFMRQLLERGPYARGPLASFYGLVGAFGWSRRARLRRAAGLRLAPRGPRPPAVDRHVADETEEPRPWLAARRVVAPRSSPDAQEGFLDGVLGEVPVAGDAERDPRGGEGREHREHERAAAGEPVHQADDEGPPAAPPRMVPLARHLPGCVQVRVPMRPSAVHVDVMVQRAAGPERAEEVQPEADQHERDTELEAVGEAGRDLRVQGDHGHRCRQQRGRVPEAPQRTDERGAPQAAPLAHDGRHGGQVIDVERVAHSEQESEAEEGERGRGHASHTPIWAMACATITRPASEMTSALATGAKRARRPSSGRRSKRWRA